MLIDTHCHLDLQDFQDDLETVVQNALNRNVKKFILPGIQNSQWPQMLKVSHKISDCFIAPGLHPCYMDFHTKEHLEKLNCFIEAHREKVVAIGETGLDLFIEKPEVDQQIEYFKQQIKIAKQFRLPLILHVRKAHDQVLKILRQNQFSHGGTVHCFSGSQQQGERYTDMGFKLGIGGVITYERSKRLQNIVKCLPLTRFVLETDAPDIPVYGKTGNRNSPEFLPEIFKSFCNYRDEKEKEIEQQLFENACQTFPSLKG